MAHGEQPWYVLLRLAFDVLGQVHRAAPRSHLLPLVAASLLLAPLGAVAAGRLARSRASAALGALAGSALAVAVSLTLFRDDHALGFMSGSHSCTVTYPVLLSGDGLANVALFFPAAFLAVLAVGRPTWVVGGIAAISVSIEGLQGLWSIGVCDTSDVLLNVAGALAAGLVAVSLRAAAGRGRGTASVPGSSSCPRSC